MAGHKNLDPLKAAQKDVIWLNAGQTGYSMSTRKVISGAICINLALVGVKQFIVIYIVLKVEKYFY